MASTLEHSSAQVAASPRGPSAADHVRFGVIVGLLGVAFWQILVRMYGSWFDVGTYMEHGILVVPAALYMAWTQLDQLRQTPVRPSGWGVALLAWGAGQAVLAIAAQWVWVSRMSFLISLVGAIAAVYGWPMVRRLMYPLGTLVLMVAPPTFVFDRLTLGLQLLASRLGEICLEALGYSVLREGNVLQMVGISLSVEEACSGIRSLLAILFMCVMYNFFFVRGNRMRGLILMMAIPIAILGNAGRIVASGIAGQFNHDLVQGATHEAFGYFSVIVAAFGCVGVHLGMLRIQKAWQAHHHA
ncbi:MAG TPA: exosortase/archaeosortase family protein [Bryobacteraceae bacterium]|nr:exosortase/archaeosortase family protein [Bryobacteraceae bacterium]HUO27895.1 exosortase/archaeosortase family protein [Bryobacteraceae bacterium]